MAGCGDPVGWRSNPQACRQTREFSNTGCVQVEGQVIGTTGQPLSGIFVTPRYLPGSPTFDSPYEKTGADGRFRLRLTRYEPLPPGLTGPDTLSIFIGAADPRSASIGVPATVRDSVLIVVTIAPVGAVPEPVVVSITLPTP